MEEDGRRDELGKIKFRESREEKVQREQEKRGTVNNNCDCSTKLLIWARICKIIVVASNKIKTLW